MERHWQKVISRSICDYFFEAQTKATSPADIPPVIATPHHFLISIFRNNMYFVSVVLQEVPPLLVVEFLHRIMDIFADYFSECTEQRIKEHYVTVYELLEEMLDNGYPLATESNILKELIRPPSLVRSVVNAMTGESNIRSQLPTGQLSNIPWRRTGVKYTNNEIFLDLIEEIDCIIDKQGSVVMSEIQGRIECNSRLSGMPDLTLSFMNARLLDDVSFHPCIRYKRWEAERVISFVPPDGSFRLLSFNITNQGMISLPIYVTPTFSYTEGGGRMELRVGPKQNMGKIVEDVVLTIPMPKTVTNVNINPSAGVANYDPVGRVVNWNIGKVAPQKYFTATGSITTQAGTGIPESNPTISVDFKVPLVTMSGLKVSRLDIYGEKYRAFKGIKYLTKAGRFQIRA